VRVRWDEEVPANHFRALYGEHTSKSRNYSCLWMHSSDGAPIAATAEIQNRLPRYTVNTGHWIVRRNLVKHEGQSLTHPRNPAREGFSCCRLFRANTSVKGINRRTQAYGSKHQIHRGEQVARSSDDNAGNINRLTKVMHADTATGVRPFGHDSVSGVRGTLVLWPYVSCGEQVHQSHF
jgi:hypothetical protein